MLIHCGLLLLFLNCVRTTEDISVNDLTRDRFTNFNKTLSIPSIHNTNRLRRESADVPKPVIMGEGGVVDGPLPLVSSSTQLPVNNGDKDIKKDDNPVTSADQIHKDTEITVGNVTSTPLTPIVDVKKGNGTDEPKAKLSDLNSPGVLKRGIIVFGGFALMAVAYFIFYRRKGKNNDTGSTHNSNDGNQFRYGVLQSDDRRDNLELSRIPLTMESDEDEDEDLEIFDLEQKKKSLSYVNLQTNDEDVVLSPSDNVRHERDDLLLDIEDGTSGTLINWSGNGNNSKSIL